MDLTKLSDADLLALKAGDYAKMSDDGLRALKASSGPAPAEPSGVAAGFAHGAEDIDNGIKQTAKQYLGVGNGPSAPADPNFVPAEVINGFNPLKWNYGQLPQKIAESAPGLAETAAAATAGSKIGGIAGIRGRLLGGLAGAAGSIWANSAGNAAKADAVSRTGDANAEPNLSDKTRAGLTEGASALAQSIGPMRFVPGAGAVTKAVGNAGLKAAAAKYLTTVGENAAAGAAGSTISQAGNTVGTDKGLSVDPSKVADAAVGNAGAAALMGAPRGIVDAHAAVSQRAFGGDNAKATAAYFNRLQDNAGAAGLGNTKDAYAAHENTVANLKKELGQVDTSDMDQDTANALSLAKSDKPITPEHVQAITAADPQAGFLARQLLVAQHAEKFGSLDAAGKSWAGGLSGIADKYAIGPLRRHIAYALPAALTGATLTGSYAIPALAGATGVYAGARALDNLTGMRSPAQGLAEKFVDQSVPTRLAPPPPPAPPPGPGPAPAPWGPRPQPTTSVPQVASPAPPEAPPMDPNAVHEDLKGMLRMAAARRQVAANNQTPPIDADALNTQVKSALLMAAARRKVAGTHQAEALADDSHVINENGGMDALNNPAFTKRANELLGAARANARLTTPPPEQEQVPTPAPTAPATPAAPAGPTFNPIALKILQQKLRIGLPSDTQTTAAPKITKKANGPVQVSQPEVPQPSAAPDAAPTQFYRPLEPSEMMFNGKALEMTPKQIGRAIADKRMADKPADVQQRYANSTADTHAERRGIVQDVIARHPSDVLPLTELMHQLHERGTAEQAKSAVNHYAQQVAPETAHDLLSGFNDEAVKRIWATKAEKKAARRKAKKSTTNETEFAAAAS